MLIRSLHDQRMHRTRALHPLKVPLPVYNAAAPYGIIDHCHDHREEQHCRQHQYSRKIIDKLLIMRPAPVVFYQDLYAQQNKYHRPALKYNMIFQIWYKDPDQEQDTITDQRDSECY